MKMKSVAIIVFAILILASIGLGYAIVYSDYLYAPNGDLTSILVYNMALEPDAEPGSVSGQDTVQIIAEVETWAEQNHACVFLKNGFVAGCGYCAYSDWMEHQLKTRINNGCVYVSDKPDFRAGYVTEGVLFPGTLNIAIDGHYDPNAVLATFQNVDFFYPLHAAVVADGMFFTDAEDASGLASIFTERGYEIYMHNPTRMTIGQLIPKLLTDSVMSITLMFALLGLVFCFVYDVLILHRDNTSRLWVHYRFGLSMRGIRRRVLVLAVFIAIVALVLIRLILTNSMTYMPAHDLNLIFVRTAGSFFVLSLCVNGLGYAGIRRQFRLKGGA